MRQEFDRKTKAEIVLRATDAKGVLRCENCGAAIKGRNFNIDHTIPDALRDADAKQKKLTAADGQLLCSGSPESCHGIKTAKFDVPAIAKAVRNEAKRLGIIRHAKPIPGSPMPTTERAAKRRANPKQPLSGQTEIARRFGIGE